MAKVNLDALIPREDFEVEDNINSGKKKETISIEDIKPDSFFTKGRIKRRIREGTKLMVVYTQSFTVGSNYSRCRNLN